MTLFKHTGGDNCTGQDGHYLVGGTRGALLGAAGCYGLGWGPLVTRQEATCCL